MSEINIDAALVAGHDHLDRTKEKLVELTDGCICRTLREDLVKADACRDARGIADLLVDQVEFADVLVLNKTDLVSPVELGRVTAVVHRLNPSARLIHSVPGEVDVTNLLYTGLFDAAAAAEAPGWGRGTRQRAHPSDRGVRHPQHEIPQ